MNYVIDEETYKKLLERGRPLTHDDIKPEEQEDEQEDEPVEQIEKDYAESGVEEERKKMAKDVLDKKERYEQAIDIDKHTISELLEAYKNPKVRPVVSTKTQSIRISLKAYDMLKELSKKEGIPIVHLGELALLALPRAIRYEQENIKLRNELAQLRDDYNKVKDRLAYVEETYNLLKDLGEYSWIGELLDEEPPKNEEVAKMRNDPFGLAVRLFKAGMKLEQVGEITKLGINVLSLAQKIALFEKLKSHIEVEKHRLGLVQPIRAVGIPKLVTIKEVDYHKVITSPIISLYYSYLKANGYEKDFASFVEECVLDACQARGIFITMVVGGK
jgi:hypothetical protein